MTRELDFIVIGAAKSGTTALFEYLRTHPELALPREKETGFFTDEALFERGWAWYERTYLADLPSGQRYGEASPSYMWGTPFAGTPFHAPVTAPPDVERPGVLESVVPQRIAETLPDVRIIALLRDPIERALSHYRMSWLWGWETRDVDSALKELLSPSRVEESRRWVTGTNWYISLGEYGRILAPYVELFPDNQIRIVFSSDLLTRRENVLREIFAFIGVKDTDWMPPNLDVRYREGATTRRFRSLDLYRWRDALSGRDRLRRAWRTIPQRQRDQLDRLYVWSTFRMDMWNAKRGQDELAVEPGVRDALEAHYEQDGRNLTELLGRPLPWLETWTSGERATAGAAG